ncbi:flagellar basal body rod protein FlgG [Pontibacillus salipaludis]|uniref:Flagellar hook protein FlgE n=1 Tax=Pontibacillus salipaludis TaxID=1697394 RepID=A0ABQ1PH09_9BACI|nr:flagellar basal body rod protein FlgG [Pontibacillus salipaludis]GGC96998.1 flagellar basal-body rod protein FlgG [Pontibacillus salipaludis]
MLRSMYAGISGMKGMQTKLDTIGNNIANVNTSGYKKGRVTFQDMMSQNLSAAEGPLAERGGINPSQVGLGSQLGTIDNIHTQGNRQTTNRPLDLSLEGDGMFVLGEGDLTTTNSTATSLTGMDAELSYTRAGNFYLDNDGYIVNADGKYVIGENATYDTDANGDLTVQPGTQYNPIQIDPSAQSFSIQTDGTVKFIDQNGNSQTAGQIQIAKFSNPGGLQKTGANNYTNTDNAGLVDNLIVPGEEGAASIVSGSLEMSNVDLAEEFTEMITAQRGFQANTRIITTSDEILQELVNLKR